MLLIGPTQWIKHTDIPHAVTGFHPKHPGGLYLDITITLDIPWEETKTYEYSKLYYSATPDSPFSEDRVICFRIPRHGVEQKIRLVLPSSIADSNVANFRVDPLAYCQAGRYILHKLEIIYQEDGDPEASKTARLLAGKQWVREQVVKCEKGESERVSHYPESLCLEITPRCNLQCGHCATHGTSQAHRSHNDMTDIPPQFLDHLNAEVFPWLTSVTTIGRGEPLFASDETWNKLIGHLRTNRVLLSVVTNGLLVKQRLTPEIIPMIDTLTFSVDGMSQETFGSNRGHAKISKVFQNIEYFHQQRRELNLPRRPRLCLSWTMKKNNIHELLDFIEFAKDFEPDLLFTRHLMIFHRRDQAQSLLNDPEICNRHLIPVYERLKELGIKTECPPLSQDGLQPNLKKAKAAEKKNNPGSGMGIDPCMFIYRTANIHADGKIHACPRPNSPFVGSLWDSTFPDIWHGETYSSIRGSLNTDNELPECRYCWYRECKYYPQRFQVDTDKRQSYSLLNPVKYLKRSWNFMNRHRTKA